MDDCRRLPLRRGDPHRPSRPAPPGLVDRFRAMVRRREDELRADDDHDIDVDLDLPLPGLSMHEIVPLFEEVLSELTFNSKPIISDLTMIARDQREHARGIADAVCDRILRAPVDQKLPSLYLLDSIVKNVGREYARHFAASLPKVFCEAYNQVSSSSCPAMRHLFGTWSQVFHPSILHKIDDELEFSAPSDQRSTDLPDMIHSASPSPQLSHGFHVNPKYMESGHQLEHPASGAQHLRGVSPSLQVYGRNPYGQYGEYDFDHTELLPSRYGIARPGSPRTAAMRTTSMVGNEGLLPCSTRRVSRSPPRVGLKRSISPVDDRFQEDISLGGVERASPSHFGYGLGRMSDQNGWLDRRWNSGDGAQQEESSIGCNLNNGYAKQRSRELIDAYGSHRERDNFHEKHPKVQRLDVISINSEATARNWQSSEEEEYVWEDMSPTLADQSNTNIHQPLRPFFGRPGLTRPDDSILESDFRRSRWADQASLCPVADEEEIPVLQSGRGSIHKYLGGSESQNESLPHYKSSHHLHETGNPHSSPHYYHQIRSPKSRGRMLQVPSSVSGTSIVQKLPAQYDNMPDDEVPFRRLSSSHSSNSDAGIPAVKEYWRHGPHSPVIWPTVLKSQSLPLISVPPNHKKFRRSSEFTEGNNPDLNQGPSSSLFLPPLQYDAADRTATLNKGLHFSNQDHGSVHVRQQSQELSSTRVQSKEAYGTFIPPTQSQVSSHLVSQPLNHVQSQGRGVVVGSDFSNSLPGELSSSGMQSVSDTTSNVHYGVLPPPPGSYPSSSQKAPASQIINPAISSSSSSAFSGLISTLMAQGLISLTPPVQCQDSVGVEFNGELLKVRHESAIHALYTDLPRQCTTCGLRFKCQEDHSSHMDWHVTKNRISKNHKQNPSRKWFVSGKEWLSGAEILGTDVVLGFLPTEAVTEKNEDKEISVPADENQNVCALCGECFEDFYCDENEEWMYRCAVYLNAPNGNIESLDRSQWGPIVHAKCRPDSTEDIGQS